MAHDNSYAQVCSLCCIEDLSPMDAEAKGFKNSNCDGDGGGGHDGSQCCPSTCVALPSNDGAAFAFFL